MVLPDRKSAKYLSCIGNLDVRVKLDAVKRDDCKYYVALSMMASKASYENAAFLKSTVEDRWKVYMSKKFFILFIFCSVWYVFLMLCPYSLTILLVICVLV